MRRRSPLITRTLALTGLAVGAVQPAFSQDDTPVFVDVRQGTDLSVATQPGLDFIVIELLGRLWRLPVTGGAATPLTAAEYAVRHPRLNQDGSRVVYQRLGATGWDIWSLDLNTGQETALTSASGHEREPDFAGDGNAVVFAADRTGGFDLWSVERPGGDWQPVTSEGGAARFPAVADNGAIAYVVDTGDMHELRVRAGGLTRTIYQSVNTLTAPSWRPGGGVIVFQERGTGTATQLLMAILAPELLIRELATDEDIFTSRVGWLDSGEFVYAADGQIWQRRLASRTRQPVHLFATAVIAAPAIPTPSLEAPGSGGNAASVQWTDDGAIGVIAIAGDLWRLGDASPQQLTDDPYWNEAPLIDPAGRFIIFARSHAGERRLWQLPLAADRRRPRAEPGRRAGIRGISRRKRFAAGVPEYRSGIFRTFRGASQHTRPRRRHAAAQRRNGSARARSATVAQRQSHRDPESGNRTD